MIALLRVVDACGRVPTGYMAAVRTGGLSDKEVDERVDRALMLNAVFVHFGHVACCEAAKERRN